MLELGCGAGALTRHLVAGGHRVIATDASPAMVALAREAVRGADEVRRLTLPDDPLPAADAVVAVGHVLSYLPDRPLAWSARCGPITRALRPGGVLAVDLLDLELSAPRGPAGRRRRRSGASGRCSPRFRVPRPRDLCIRAITTFVRAADGTWQRDDERHVNALVDAAEMARRLAAEGLEEVEVARGFDAGQRLEDGLVADHRRAAALAGAARTGFGRGSGNGSGAKAVESPVGVDGPVPAAPAAPRSPRPRES